MNAIAEEEFDGLKKVDLNVWKKLVKYAMRYKKLVVALLVSMAFVAAVDICYPLLTRYAVDNFIVPGNVEGVLPFALVYLLFIVVQAVGVIYFVSGAGKLEMNISYDIRQEGFRKLQELSFSYYDKTAVGYIMARMVSDVARISELIAWSLVDLMWALTFVIGCMAIMFALNAKLALIALCVVPPLAVLCVVFRRLILKYQRLVRKNNSKITGAFNEGIMGAMTTKTLVREELNSRDFTKITGEMKRVSVRSLVLSAVFMPLVMFLGTFGTAMALYYGGNMVLAAALGFGTLSAFISYTTQIFDPISMLARILAEMQSAQASAERVLSLLATEIEVQDTPEVIEEYGTAFEPKRENWPELHGDVEFRNVSFRYKKGENVLDDFSLNVSAGQTIALVGETGAGKSTIINLVCRFYEPTSGQILIDGVDYRERSILWLQENTGYVLQSPHLFSGSIRDNIAFSNKDATMEQVESAAKMVHAHSFIMEQDKGYDTEVGEGGIRLSTGQKQLISFARVILSDPRIFVLDEATSSIDTETEQLIQNAITTVLKGRTSFIVAHRLSTIRGADKILVIDAGKIAEAGSHEELMARRGMYYKLYTNQFREESTLDAVR